MRIGGGHPNHHFHPTPSTSTNTLSRCRAPFPPPFSVLRSFHNLKRQFLLNRFFILKTCISALKKNAEYSIAFTEMLLLKASRFFFLFYAGKSFRSWAANATSSRAHLEGLLRRHVLQKFFLPWGSQAVASSHHHRKLKRKTMKCWIAVTLFDRRLKYLTSRNTHRRNVELKYRVLSCLYRFVSCRRKVVEFRYESLFRLVTRVFGNWKQIVEEFRWVKGSKSDLERTRRATLTLNLPPPSAQQALPRSHGLRRPPTPQDPKEVLLGTPREAY